MIGLWKELKVEVIECSCDKILLLFVLVFVLVILLIVIDLLCLC